MLSPARQVTILTGQISGYLIWLQAKQIQLFLKMVNMQLTNKKIVNRGVKMLMEKSGITSETKAKQILLKYGSVKKAIESYK